MFFLTLEPPCEDYLIGLPAGIYLLEASRQEETFEPRRLIFASPRLKALAGTEDLFPLLWRPEALHPDDREGLEKAKRQLLSRKGELWRSFRLRRPDGSYVQLREGVSLFREEEEGRLTLIGLWIKLGEEALPSQGLPLWITLLEKAPVGLVLYDLQEGTFLYANSYALNLLGYSLEELRQKRVWEVVHPRFQEEVRKNLERRAKGKDFPYTYQELHLLTRGGQEKLVTLFTETVHLEDQRVGVGIGIDLTPQRVLERRLTELAFFDPLTGLPNRQLFLEKLRAFIARGLRKREQLMVMVLDLMDFREVNTVWGYQAGNRILREVARRLERNLRRSDVKSRFFADRFGLICMDVRGTWGIRAVQEKIEALFRRPFRVNGGEIALSFRAGVSLFPRDGSQAEDLLAKAEAALKRAKEHDERMAVFSSELERSLTEEALLRTAMQEGLRRGEFFPVYQPIVRLSDRKVVGVEALVRWNHRELGVLPPSRFIPLAEKSGFIHELGEFMLRRALEDLSPCLSREECFVCVNLSARQFRDPALSRRIESALKRTGFPPERLHLEITETTAMEEPEKTLTILSKLRRLGVKIVLDDFGMGYSSMRYLVDFEVDKIKIDRFFVENLLFGEKPRYVVRTITGLAHNVGARSVAEGIEKEEQVRILLELGCEEGQGFLFSPPLELPALKEFLEKCAP